MIASEAYCQPCDMPIHTRIFDGGMEEVVRSIEHGRIPVSQTLTGSIGEFADTASMEEALSLARYGWYAGGAAIQDLMDRNFRVVPGQRRELYQEDIHDVAGDDFDLGRYVTGQTDYMERAIEDNPGYTPGRFLNVLIDRNYNKHVGPEEFLAHSTTIAAAVLSLEDRGIQVGVGLMNRMWNITGRATKKVGIEYYTPLKNPHEPLNLPQLAFTLAHGSMPYRIETAIMDQEPDEAIRRYLCSGEYVNHHADGSKSGYGGRALGRKLCQEHIPQFMRITREGIILGGEMYDGTPASVERILDTVNHNYEAMQARDRERARQSRY